MPVYCYATAGTENSNAIKHPIIYLIFIQCLLSAEL